MSNMNPLINAPEGYIWRWESRKEAHLFALTGPALCGHAKPGPRATYQVGGYSSAQPCPRCLELRP